MSGGAYHDGISGSPPKCGVSGHHTRRAGAVKRATLYQSTERTKKGETCTKRGHQEYQ